MDKDLSPSDERLQELREQGIVPYSPIATKCGLTIFVLGSTIGVGSELGSFWRIFRANLAADVRTVDLPVLLSQAMEPLLKALLIPSVAALFGTFICGWIQTKFLIHSELGFDLSRLYGRPFRGAVFRMLSAFPLLFTILIVGMLPALLLMHDLLAVLNNGRDFLALWASRLSVSLITLSCFVLGIAGILTWLFSRFIFMRSHRMSYEELQKKESY